jgi:hypothetical protein
MTSVVSFAEPRNNSPARAHITRNFYLFLDLLAPALLLGLWRVWTSTQAPRWSVYFTGEALLIAYAYFAVVRSVYLNAHSTDGSGNYNRALALKAARNLHHGLRPYWTKIAIAVLALLVAGVVLDMLTAGSRMQHRPNVHLSILFVEIMVWARYGAAIVIAAATWSPPQPAEFARARRLANHAPIARSFALVNLAFGAAAVVILAAYKFGGPLLPTPKAGLVCALAVFTGLAMLALWLQCRWAMRIMSQIADENALDDGMLVITRAASVAQ